jgi:hypothetical protein
LFHWLFYQRLFQDSFSLHCCKRIVQLALFPASSSGLYLAEILQKKNLTFLPAAIPGLILATLLQNNYLTFLPAAIPGLLLATFLQKNCSIGLFLLAGSLELSPVTLLQMQCFLGSVLRMEQSPEV